MLILLSDGAGLTARQCATLLARAGHRVEALSPDPLCLCRLTRHVRAVHRVPGFGADPFGWLDAALDIAARCGAELLLPVQEQVSVMALARDRIEAAGLLTAVPDFGALAQLQDKLSAYRTLARARRARSSSTSTRAWSNRSTPTCPALTWRGRWSRSRAAARRGRARPGRGTGRGSGPTSCCSRCSARPSGADGSRSPASCVTR